MYFCVGERKTWGWATKPQPPHHWFNSSLSFPYTRTYARTYLRLKGFFERKKGSTLLGRWVRTISGLCLGWPEPRTNERSPLSAFSPLWLFQHPRASLRTWRLKHETYVFYFLFLLSFVFLALFFFIGGFCFVRGSEKYITVKFIFAQTLGSKLGKREVVWW